MLIRRLPERRPVAWSRSACEHCGTVLGWRDLVPLASYAWLRGRCRYCAAPIGAFHPAIELLATAVALWAVLVAEGPGWTLATCVLGWTLLAMAWIDATHLRLPDVLTLPLIVAGLFATWLLEPWMLVEHAAGAATGYLAFRLFALTYRSLRGQEGLGGGDAKLLAAGGAWVGLAALPLVIFAAATMGIAWVLVQRARGRDLGRYDRIPFGPFLALGIWIVMMHGAVLGP